MLRSELAELKAEARLRPSHASAWGSCGAWLQATSLWRAIACTLGNVGKLAAVIGQVVLIFLEKAGWPSQERTPADSSRRHSCPTCLASTKSTSSTTLSQSRTLARPRTFRTLSINMQVDLPLLAKLCGGLNDCNSADLDKLLHSSPEDPGGATYLAITNICATARHDSLVLDGI